MKARLLYILPILVFSLAIGLIAISDNTYAEEDESVDGTPADEYVYLDKYYHNHIDADGNVIKERHNWGEGSAEWTGDEDDHTLKYTCDQCGAIKTEEESHDWECVSVENEGVNDGHSFAYVCADCGGTKSECELHDWSYYVTEVYKKYNNKYHIYVDEECYMCDAVKGDLEEHLWDHVTYKTLNGTYHSVKKKCDYCGQVVTTKVKHKTYKKKIVRKATLKKKGLIKYVCKCGRVIKSKKVAWKRGTNYSVSYDVTWNTYVYKNSKSITVTLKKPVKGSKVVVQIGKKIYTKKVGKSKKVKLKIKKPKKYGSKIYIDVKYKGKWIGEAPYYDVVYYAKGIRKGMTKKQFKYTRYYWGSPDDTASASGGWTYWYYDDGSYIGFKNGKVRFWYNAD